MVNRVLQSEIVRIQLRFMALLQQNKVKRDKSTYTNFTLKFVVLRSQYAFKGKLKDLKGTRTETTIMATFLQLKQYTCIQMRFLAWSQLSDHPS